MLGVSSFCGSSGREADGTRQQRAGRADRLTVMVSDTTPAARAVQTRLYRAAGGEKRLLMALRMSEDVRRIAEADRLHHHPKAPLRHARWTCPCGSRPWRPE